MSLIKRAGLLFACLLGLAACGGNPLDFDDAAPFGPLASDELAILSDAYDRLSAEVLGLEATPSGGMDTSGNATFTGLAEMTVTQSGSTDRMTLIGEATLIANFQTRAVTASMNNFAGTDMSGAGERLDGSLTMSDGTIGMTSANDLSGTFRGTLVAEEFVIVTGGQLDGTFRDTPTTAVSFTGVDDSAAINGQPAQVTLSGVAQD